MTEQVADHFDGFSLYDTKAHNYSVGHSPWRHGSGNIIAMFVASCRKFGVRPAFYYSVHENWYEGISSFQVSDPEAQAAYEDMAMLQLREILQIFADGGAEPAEIWFDAGVKQTDGFVARVNSWVSSQMPNATCHSCSNMPDVHAVSWMGNEETVMKYPMWNANDENGSYSGSGDQPYGIPDGTRWMPAHCDAVLRRHFWFWDAASYNSTANLNSPAQLLGMHLTSIGRGCNMILDMSPTPSGLLQANDVETYQKFGLWTQRLYNHSLAAEASPPPTRGQAVVEIEIELPPPPPEQAVGGAWA
jgi:alpha-L-fucosidase